MVHNPPISVPRYRFNVPYPSRSTAVRVIAVMLQQVEQRQFLQPERHLPCFEGRVAGPQDDLPPLRRRATRAAVVAAPMPSEFPTIRIRFAMNYILRQGRPYDRARTNVDVLVVLDTEPEPVKTVEERVEPVRPCFGN